MLNESEKAFMVGGNLKGFIKVNFKKSLMKEMNLLRSKLNLLCQGRV